MESTIRRQDDYPLPLTDQQHAFVTHRDGPALLLAVPGSGKTTAIVCRVAALIRSGVPKNGILTMTFTRAAAMDMRLRFSQLFPEHAPMNAFHTIHGFSWRILQTFSSLRERPMPEILSEATGDGNSRMALLRQVCESATGVRMNEERLEQMATAISLAKNRMVRPEVLRDSGEVGIPGFCETFRAYESAKKDMRRMDYDDLLTAALQVLERDSGVREHFCRQYPYIQVDEAQDNSVIQHRIVETLAHPAQNLVLIGDEDQSIYVWRGADPAGLLSFRERFPDAVSLFMETNFRSGPQIVAVADRFIRTNRNRADKHMVSGRVLEKPVRGEAAPLRIERLADAHAQYQRLSVELLEGMGHGSQAVLYRMNRSAFGIADALDRAGIPFRLRDYRDTLFTHPVTRDIRAMMRLACDPADRVSFLQVYAKLGAYLPKTLRGYMDRQREGESVWKVAMRYPLLREYQKQKLHELDRMMKKVAGMKPERGLPLLLSHVDYDAALDWSADALGLVRESMAAVKALLLDLAIGEPNPAGYLDRLDHLRERMAGACREESRHAVLLSTIHAAKGLEFDRVLLVDALDADFPGDTGKPGANLEAARLEEERRLFYVAMTRARKEFVMMMPDAGGKNAVSRFVREAERCMAEPVVTGGGDQ